MLLRVRGEFLVLSKCTGYAKPVVLEDFLLKKKLLILTITIMIIIMIIIIIFIIINYYNYHNFVIF